MRVAGGAQMSTREIEGREEEGSSWPGWAGGRGLVRKKKRNRSKILVREDFVNFDGFLNLRNYKKSKGLLGNTK